MFNFVSTVSTVSKSFSDLLGIWKGRESLHAKEGDVKSPTDTARPSNRQPHFGKVLEKLTSVASQNTNDNSNGELKESKWKSEARLASLEKNENIVRAATPFGQPPAETVSLCSLRSSNRNIGYLAKNIRTVSTQSVCQTTSIEGDTEDTTIKNEEHDPLRKDAERQSITSDSHMYIKSPMLNNQSSLIKRPPYKKKQTRKDGDEHTSLRRKHSKPKSESGNEMALVQKSNIPSTSRNTMEIQTDASFNIDMDKTRLSLSVSQQSLQHVQGDNDDSVFAGDVKSERSLSLPPGTCITFLLYEPRREKTGLRGFRPGPTQTGLYKLRKELEA